MERAGGGRGRPDRAPADWEARFISPVGLAGLRQPAPEMRGKVHVPGRVVKARLFASAQLAPGWTAYQHRLRYRAYDVTALVSGAKTRSM